MIEDIHTITTTGYLLLGVKYIQGEDYVTQIQPPGRTSLTINGEYWIDCYNKKYSLSSFEAICKAIYAPPSDDN